MDVQENNMFYSPKRLLTNEIRLENEVNASTIH